MMQSVPATAVEYERAPRKALEDLRDALARFEQVYNPTLTGEGWDFRTNTGYETWSFSQTCRANPTDLRVCERLKFVFQCVALACRHVPELFGILVVPHKQDELDIVSWITIFIRTANRNETFEFARYPLLDFEQKLHEFEYEILRSTPPATQQLNDPKEGKQGDDGRNDNANPAILKGSDLEAKAFMDGKRWCTAAYSKTRFGIQGPQLTKASTSRQGLYGVVVQRKRAQVEEGKKGIRFVFHFGSLQLLKDAIDQSKSDEE
jgi:hypothetical protein